MGNMQNSMGVGVSNRFKIKGDIGWEGLIMAFEKADSNKLEEIVCTNLIQSKQIQLNTIIAQIPKGLPKNDRIIKATLLAMATPEYQLC
jgi:hypothetical protein